MTQDADAPPDVAPECTDTSVTCVGNTLRDCSAGSSAVVTMCAHGCLDTVAPAHCGFQPSGGAVADTDLQGSGSDNMTFGGVIDTANPSWPDHKTVTIPGTGGLQVTILRFRNLKITNTVTFAPSDTTTPKPAIAFVATGTIVVNALIDGRPTTTCNGQIAGPGGFIGGAPETPGGGSGGGGADNDPTHGGAGGGYGGNGGSGGGATTAGPAFGDDEITKLFGGGGGGGGGGTNGGTGGGGGAAIQLVAGTSITFMAMGKINAGGCGGEEASQNGNSGGGGGAGGSILVEAPAVKIDGVLAANGGGGASGDGNGNPGKPGSTDVAQAGAGGGGDGAGGKGGAAAISDGAAGTQNNEAGGGGGGVGRIRINTLDGTTTGAGVISPTVGQPGMAKATKGLIKIQ